MTGLDSYSASKKTFVGLDWMSLASGGLKTAGGAFGGGAGTDAAAAAQAKALADKAAAEKSASNWKLVGVVAIVVLIGGYMVYQRAPQPTRALTRTA